MDVLDLVNMTALIAMTTPKRRSTATASVKMAGVVMTVVQWSRTSLVTQNVVVKDVLVQLRLTVMTAVNTPLGICTGPVSVTMAGLDQTVSHIEQMVKIDLMTFARQNAVGVMALMPAIANSV
jgi:hypothetical protein